MSFLKNRYLQRAVEYQKIYHHRSKAMSYYLNAATVRLATTIDTKRSKDEDLF